MRPVIERINGRDGSPYRTLVKLSPRTRWGQLRLHVFWRGDNDPHLHDHPSDFWTFPLTPYEERVAARYTHHPARHIDPHARVTQYVQAWRLHRRPAEYEHRLVGRLRYVGRGLWLRRPGPVVTLAWWGPPRRAWGFWTGCGWIPQRRYLHEGPALLRHLRELSAALRGVGVLYEGAPAAPTRWHDAGRERLHYDDVD